MKLGEVLQCSGEDPYQGTGPSLWKVLSSFSNKNLLDYTLILFKQSKMNVTLLGCRHKDHKLRVDFKNLS